MPVPDGEFVIVVECADCGKELNRSRPITRKDYTLAVIGMPLQNRACQNGCRASDVDWNANVKTRWERPDGTPIPKDTAA